jgi:hypothetical protein
MEFFFIRISEGAGAPSCASILSASDVSYSLQTTRLFRVQAARYVPLALISSRLCI